MLLVLGIEGIELCDDKSARRHAEPLLELEGEAARSTLQRYVFERIKGRKLGADLRSTRAEIFRRRISRSWGSTRSVGIKRMRGANECSPGAR